MKKDNIKTLVTILVICTVLVVVVLVLDKKSNSEKIKSVNEYNTFFSTAKYVNNYIEYVSRDDNEKTYNLLYYDYVKKNNITIENVFDKIKKYPINSSINITKMDYVKVKNNYIYYVKGKVYQNTIDNRVLIDNNFETLVLTDFNNLSYSIYPIVSNKYKTIIDDIKNINIAINDNNHLKELSPVTKEDVCVLYLSDYLDKIVNDTNFSYSILSPEMKDEYISIENFDKYIKNNFNRITTLANKCSKYDTDDGRVYTVIDKNKNKFIFKEKSIMNYEVEFYLYEQGALND